MEIIYICLYVSWYSYFLLYVFDKGFITSILCEIISVIAVLCLLISLTYYCVCLAFRDRKTRQQVVVSNNPNWWVFIEQ